MLFLLGNDFCRKLLQNMYLLLKEYYKRKVFACCAFLLINGTTNGSLILILFIQVVGKKLFFISIDCY